MAHKKDKRTGELSIEDMKNITVGTTKEPETDEGACDIKRPTDCD